MSFAQTCHMSYTIDYLSEGGYQSHSVTLTCVDFGFPINNIISLSLSVDRDSCWSRLGLTVLQSTEKYLRVYSLGMSLVFIRTKDRNNGISRNHVSRRRQDQVRRALCEARHESLKHGDINRDWNRFWFIKRGLRCKHIASLCLRASLFPLSLQPELSTTTAFVLPVLLCSRSIL